MNVAVTGFRVWGLGALGLPRSMSSEGRPFSVSFILLLPSSPNPGKPGLAAHPFKSAWESPGPPSPARAGTSKRPPRDPVAEGAGGPRGGGFAELPFIPAGSRPPGCRSGLQRVPAGQGREHMTAKQLRAVCLHACHCLSLGLSFPSCPPPPRPASAGSGWSLGGIFWEVSFTFLAAHTLPTLSGSHVTP